jgi:protein-S-isoprenylcysteine O-methyltransferase Ste14
MADGQGTLAPWDPTAALVVRGAYRHLRNPMKAGLFLLLSGEAVVFRSLPLLGWFAVFALANVAYIRLFEEPGLRKRFGAAYGHYCARVPRWLPSSSRAYREVEGTNR